VWGVSSLFRDLPKMDGLLADDRLGDLPRSLCRDVANEVLDELRDRLREGELEALPDVAVEVADRVRALLRGRHRAVINATGVVLHTNLGRAPWPEQAVQAAIQAARYGNVEIDLASGRRGQRLDGVSALLRHLTGCEAAIVVNNGAAAVLLALTAFARDREVLVSRGELVEIGGSYRVPDVISAGGARLVDVGTTNRTRIADYAAAVTDDTGVVLRVHPSNFRIVGFTERPTLGELTDLATEHGLVSVHDLGSGALEGWRDEPSVRDSVQAGFDVVIFSGDKLLGGPQAGIALGRAGAIQRLRKHPLYRALRVDKVTLAALEATLAVHLAGGQTPTQAMLDAPMEELARRAAVLRDGLIAEGFEADVAPGTSAAGGGSLPGEGLDSRVVVVRHPGPHNLHTALRTGEPAVVARVSDDTLVFDVRTLTEDDLKVLPGLVAAARDRG
jgi:L-seryl-tRNA(Ser) seleniumtransferase